MPERDPAEKADPAPAHLSLQEKLLRKLGAGERGRGLAGGAAGSFLLKGFSYLAAFLTTVMLTNVLGAERFGAYAYGMNWVYILMVPAVLGFDRLLLREIPVLEHRADFGKLRGLLRYSHKLILGISFALAMVAAGVATWMTRLDDVSFAMTRATQIAMLLLPVFALLRLRQTILLAKRKFVTAQIGELGILPWGTLVLIGAIVLIDPNRLSAELAILTYFISGMIGILFLYLKTRNEFDSRVYEASPDYTVRVWLTAAVPMLLVAGMQILNQRIDILMVGSMLGAEDVGIYAVANRGVLLVWLAFFAVNQPLAPVVAKLHEEQNRRSLQNLLVRAARISLLLAVPVAALLILFASTFLGFFGAEFRAGHDPMVIMSVGQVITMGFGSVSTALVMTGNERTAAVGIGISVLLNIALNLLLIPIYGMTGAAWALAAGQVTAAAIMSIFVRRNLRINSTALGQTS